jgi:hypothetical protein
MPSRFNPGCCGCSTACEIGADDFSGALDDWTTTGSPSTSGGLLLASGGDELIYDLEPASASSAVHIAVNALTEDATAGMRLVCARADEDNYLFGEVAKAGGAVTLRLGQAKDGAETWLTDAVTVQDAGSELDESHAISLCWRPSGIIAEQSYAVELTPWRAYDSGGWDDEANVLAYGSPSASSVEFIASGGASETDPLVVYFQGSLPVGTLIDGIEIAANVSHTPTSESAEITDTFVRLQNSGGYVGDNEAGLTVINTEPPGPPSGLGWGGPTNNWNAGITWEDINSIFGVGLAFTRGNTDDGTTINLYDVVCVIHVTEPERRTGRLTLAYGNSAVAETDCVTEYNVTLLGDGLDGKGTGLAFGVGDWELGNWALSYKESDTRPDCPECECTTATAEPCPCCDIAPAAAYVVDLGAGGWTDSQCNDCDDIDGAFVVDALSACGWSYARSYTLQERVDEVYCDDMTQCGIDVGILVGGVAPYSCSATKGWGVNLAINNIDGDGCRWRATVHYSSGGCSGTAFPQPTPSSCIHSQVIYESDVITDSDCYDMPVTLTKVFEDARGTCTGAMPETIEVDLA